MSSVVSRLFGAATSAGRGAAAAATAAALVVRGGGVGGIAKGWSAVGGEGQRMGAGIHAAERQVDEVVRILSPGPLAAHTENPPITEEEIRAAGEAVRVAKIAWRDRSRAA
mmetsp:Transcript_43796/g.70379  ORF Transcript_43796/g.70379 Transcript_43796/m.70379 type:complete len:111 (-) Transcript_43796:86-418(-)